MLGDFFYKLLLRKLKIIKIENICSNHNLRVCNDLQKSSETARKAKILFTKLKALGNY